MWCTSTYFAAGGCNVTTLGKTEIFKMAILCRGGHLGRHLGYLSLPKAGSITWSVIDRPIHDRQIISNK